MHYEYINKLSAIRLNSLNLTNLYQINLDKLMTEQTNYSALIQELKENLKTLKIYILTIARNKTVSCLMQLSK